MKLREIKEILNADVIVGEDKLDIEVKTAFGADLMSDVLAFAKAGSMLLTGLTNTQVVRIANVLDIEMVPGIVTFSEAMPFARFPDTRIWTMRNDDLS